MKLKLNVKFRRAKKFRVIVLRGCVMRVAEAKVLELAALEAQAMTEDWRLNSGDDRRLAA